MANSQLIDHEAATREIAKGLELTTRLHSLLRGAGGGPAKSSGDGHGQVRMESLSQEIMQVLVAALSLLMPKPIAVPPPPASAVAVVERPPMINSTATTTAAAAAASARARAPVALDITLACPGREEIKISSSEEVVEISAASEEKTHKQDRKRTHLQSGTMISYEHSSDDHQWKLNDDEKKINKTKLPRNNQHSSTITTTSPFNDGHQWRKYGEKKICNSRMPRCYYRCTYKDDQGCPATKQVQQTESVDPPTYVVTYKQQHSCKNRALPVSSHLVVVDPPPVDLCHLRL
ncbi:putative WRKY transcription factor 70 [Iris pallida]|uniref:WRKY transcription factor 70 n=1 Tax=Iris pallida TaxID=29817 RepID=A0AAX6I1U7_IRIPA|nr:putative WRKY transcription factor 70 [Iris pallida]